ncbi:MAG: hypothetical protein ACX936_06880 [Marinobacter sp.]
MNIDFLASALINDTNFALQRIDSEGTETPNSTGTRAFFEMVTEDGRVIGYIKSWHESDDYAGFVHFDTEGNIVDWKTFAKGIHRKT